MTGEASSDLTFQQQLPRRVPQRDPSDDAAPVDSALDPQLPALIDRPFQPFEGVALAKLVEHLGVPVRGHRASGVHRNLHSTPVEGCPSLQVPRLLGEPTHHVVAQGPHPDALLRYHLFLVRPFQQLERFSGLQRSDASRAIANETPLQLNLLHHRVVLARSLRVHGPCSALRSDPALYVVLQELASNPGEAGHVVGHRLALDLEEFSYSNLPDDIGPPDVLPIGHKH
mmetsp:Transcript_70368/g.195851  ORF Transcript_70368/g.195851 Transcript_70368/m.195851 type:complete len:228 (+) Transcript_70368:73-756(+)